MKVFLDESFLTRKCFWNEFFFSHLDESAPNHITAVTELHTSKLARDAAVGFGLDKRPLRRFGSPTERQVSDECQNGCQEMV